MFKVKLPQGNVFKSYDIEEIANIVISNKNTTFELYLDYRMLSNREFIDLYFKETKNTMMQMHLTEALIGKKTIFDIYNKTEKEKCACCNRQSVNTYRTIKEDFAISYCEKHETDLLEALYIYCTHGQEEYQKFITNII